MCENMRLYVIHVCVCVCVYFCLCVCVLCTSPCWCVYVNILKTKNILKNTRNLQRGARTMISYLHRPLRTPFSNSKEWQAVLVWSRDLQDTLRSCKETLDSGGRRHGQRKNLATDIPGWTGRSTRPRLASVPGFVGGCCCCPETLHTKTSAQTPVHKRQNCARI